MLVVGDHTGPVTTLTFMPDQPASERKQGWQRAALGLPRRPSTTIGDSRNPVVSAAVSPTGNDFAIAADQSVKLCHVNPPTPSVALAASGPVTTVAFVSGGQWLAVGVGTREIDGEPGNVTIWRLSDRKPVLAHNEPNGVGALAAAPQHKILAWSTGTRRVAMRDLTRPDAHVFPVLKKSATTLAMSPDARWLAAGDDWSIRVGTSLAVTTKRI